MEPSSVRPADDIESIVHTYGTTLFRLCLVMLGSESDAEDAVQDTILTYLQKAPRFTDAGHEKAWLITVAANRCRDMRRRWARHPQLPLEALERCGPDREDCGVLEALMQVPPRFRVVLILYYVEEYPMEEIARIIGRSVSAVKMRLQKGRRLLEEIYRKEYL